MSNQQSEFHKVIDKATEILTRNSEIHDRHTYSAAKVKPYDLEIDQPKNISWVTIDVSTEELAADDTTAIVYDNANDMKAEILEWVSNIVSPDLLELVRSGQIKHLSLHIGPYVPSGDLNDPFDVEDE